MVFITPVAAWMIVSYRIWFRFESFQNQILAVRCNILVFKFHDFWQKKEEVC